MVSLYPFASLDIEKEGSHMRAKWLRAASLAALLGLVAVVPASTQILSGSAGSDGEAGVVVTRGGCPFLEVRCESV